MSPPVEVTLSWVLQRMRLLGLKVIIQLEAFPLKKMFEVNVSLPGPKQVMSVCQVQSKLMSNCQVQSKVTQCNTAQAVSKPVWEGDHLTQSSLAILDIFFTVVSLLCPHVESGRTNLKSGVCCIIWSSPRPPLLLLVELP